MRQAGKRDREYPVPLEPLDLSGRIKAETLKTIFIEETLQPGGWCTAEDLLKDPVVGLRLYWSQRNAVSMELLRYYRQGLLLRRRRGRCYEYKLSEKGHDRLWYFWRKFGYIA